MKRNIIRSIICLHNHLTERTREREREKREKNEERKRREPSAGGTLDNDNDNGHSFSQLSVRTALTCPEGQSARTLLPSLFGKMFDVSGYTCAGLVAHGMKWRCSCCETWCSVAGALFVVFAEMLLVDALVLMKIKLRLVLEPSLPFSLYLSYLLPLLSARFLFLSLLSSLCSFFVFLSLPFLSFPFFSCLFFSCLVLSCLVLSFLFFSCLVFSFLSFSFFHLLIFLFFLLSCKSMHAHH